jgi:hypothetical protein
MLSLCEGVIHPRMDDGSTDTDTHSFFPAPVHFEELLTVTEPLAHSIWMQNVISEASPSPEIDRNLENVHYSTIISAASVSAESKSR